MTATHKPFKSAALGYHAVLRFMKDYAPATNPKTIEQIYSAVKDEVKNLQQVRDAITTFRNKGYIASMREGREIVVWYKEGTVSVDAPITTTEIVKPAILSQPTIAEEVRASDLPEVQITKNRINILAGGVKISIERY